MEDWKGTTLSLADKTEAAIEKSTKATGRGSKKSAEAAVRFLYVTSESSKPWAYVEPIPYDV